MCYIFHVPSVCPPTCACDTISPLYDLWEEFSLTNKWEMGLRGGTTHDKGALCLQSHVAPMAWILSFTYICPHNNIHNLHYQFHNEYFQQVALYEWFLPSIFPHFEILCQIWDLLPIMHKTCVPGACTVDLALSSILAKTKFGW